MWHKNAFITLILLISINTSFVFAADWKYFGGLIQEKETLISYYDDSSVQSSNKGMIKIWTKSITKTELDRVSKKQKKKLIESSAKKLVAGYYPPYSILTPNVEQDTAVEMILWEEVANSSETNTKVKILFELNCKENKIRNLSVIFYNNNKTMTSRDKEDEWIYISPESNSETLQKIFCNR